MILILHCPPQPFVTEHVIIRGRYAALEISFIGRLDHGPSAALDRRLAAATGQETAAASSEAGPDGPQAPREVEASAPSTPPLFQGIKLPLGQAALQAAAAAATPAFGIPPPHPQGLVGPLPLMGLPRFIVHAMQQASVDLIYISTSSSSENNEYATFNLCLHLSISHRRALITFPWSRDPISASAQRRPLAASCP